MVKARRGELECERSYRAAADAAGIGRVGDAGAAAIGSRDPVHDDARESKWLGSDGNASISPTVPGSQRQHSGGAASKCVDRGVLRAVPGSKIANGSASAWIRVGGIAMQPCVLKATGH